MNKQKLNIGVHGASGKVGSLISAELANHRSCNLGYKYSQNMGNIQDLISKSDIIIDFSTSKATEYLLKNIKYSKVVIGTTGFTDSQISLIEKKSKQMPILYSPNMSIGINLIRKILIDTQKLLQHYKFEAEILDVHHINKLDSPSGTAIMLARSLGLDHTICSSERDKNTIAKHIITLKNNEEEIILEHKNFSRNLFAKGSIDAALWLSQKSSGLYNMMDCLEWKS